MSSATANTAWVFPASFGQERIWMAAQLDPASHAYNVPSPVRLPYALSEAQVVAAFAQVVARHEALRTSFRSEDGAVVQVVHAPVAVEIPSTDLRHLSPAEQRKRLRQLHAPNVEKPFSLDRPPLWRAHLVRLADAEWELLVVVHHSVFDAASYVILCAELEELCRAEVDGRPPQLPVLEIQYPDYAVWQRQVLSGQELEKELAYWRERLVGAPLVHALPTDRPRPATLSDAGSEVRFPLPGPVRAAVDHLARQLRATPFMVMMAAFTGLVSRLSGEPDVVIGVPVAGRDVTQVEPLIGMFVNTVAVRTATGDDPTFSELVGRIKVNLLESWEHQRTPLQKVVEDLAPVRDPSVTPLCQIGFNYIPYVTLPNTYGAVHDDLALDLTDSEGRLCYRTDLFDEETVGAMAERYIGLLAAASGAPGARLSELPVLTASERQLVVSDWNATDADFPADATLAELVEAQVARTPHAVALTFEGQHLSFAELDARANQVAHRLRRLGVGPETPVGVCAERSPELVVGLLAVVKAGGAFVPLDPDYPADRLNFMVRDADAPLVLAQRRLLGRLPATDAAVLLLDEPSDWADEPRATLSPLAGPENLAYVIYTSGSTGRPKGVANTHRAISNRLDWMQKAYRLGAGDVVLQKTPASFDVSVWEFFWPLMTGARMVLAQPGGHRDMAYLRRLIVAEQVTVVHFVPSVLAMFVGDGKGDGSASSCSSLRLIVASGEELPVEVARQCVRLLPGAELHNLYGPTEAAVDVSAWHCDPRALDEVQRVPIGEPIQNLRLYVLDPRLEPVPVGVLGELHIAGVGLARGYVNRPDLTAASFIPDPFGPPGSRLYRTGDLARWRRDGTVEFLGRIDHQVKIRGLRVELGEIEAVLSAQPGVRDAAVVLRAGAPGDDQLVAYVAAHPGGPPDPTALRAVLRRELPDYMVPSTFVALEELPLTPNGKLDRNALPSPAPEQAPARPFVAPRTASEELVASVWAEVLGQDQFGVHDGFFEVGGHSLLAMRVVSRLSAALGIELPIHTFFEQPTVAQLADGVERLIAADLEALSDDEVERLLAEEAR